jgi:hypothetical protein
LRRGSQWGRKGTYEDEPLWEETFVLWEVGLQEADNGRHRAVVACRSLIFWNTESIEGKEKVCRLYYDLIISALHQYFVAFSLPLCFSLAWRRRMGRSGQKKKFPRQRRSGDDKDVWLELPTQPQQHHCQREIPFY